jgi:hypothetical protein
MLSESRPKGGFLLRKNHQNRGNWFKKNRSLQNIINNLLKMRAKNSIIGSMHDLCQHKPHLNIHIGLIKLLYSGGESHVWEDISKRYRSNERSYGQGHRRDRFGGRRRCLQ